MTDTPDTPDTTDAPDIPDAPTQENPAQGHPTQGLDDTVHQRARLGVLAVLHESPRAEFTFLRTALDLTAGNLSRHLQVLEEAGLVEVDKGYEGRRARTWVRITKQGRAAFLAEIARLKELIRLVEGAADPS